MYREHKDYNHRTAFNYTHIDSLITLSYMKVDLQKSVINNTIKVKKIMINHKFTLYIDVFDGIDAKRLICTTE